MTLRKSSSFPPKKHCLSIQWENLDSRCYLYWVYMSR